MRVQRPSTTPRRGAVSRARTSAGSAPAPATASGATPPTTSLMEPVWSWSAEKVNKVTALFALWVLSYDMARDDLDRHLSLTCLPLPLSLTLCPSFFSQGRWRIRIMTTAWRVRRAAASVSCVSQRCCSHSTFILSLSEHCPVPTDRTLLPACGRPCSRVFPGGALFKKVELSFFVCFQQITPGIVCPALRAFTSKAVCLAVAMCDLASLHSLCLPVHCRTKRAFFLLWK